jgi:replicative DNA helicase
MDDLHELRVLGTALAQTGLWASQAARIKPDLFQTNYQLGAAICVMTATGTSLDPQSVQAYLADKGIKYLISDLMRIADCGAFTTYSLELSVDALHEAAKRRSIQRLAGQIMTQLEAPGVSADEIIQATMLNLADIDARSSAEPLPIGEVFQHIIAGIDKPRQDGCETGIKPIDRMTAGFKPSELIILGARPSMGKTSLAVGFCRQAAAAGKTVVFFSLEMSAEQVGQRLLADLSSVTLARIATHRLGMDDLNLVLNAANTGHNFRLFIGESVENLESTCRQIQHRDGLDLVIVDYLQLMQVKAESREQQIATITRKLKHLARQLAVPVLALSQLNRALEMRANKRPQLSDLRESGAIEQDADIVMLLWREAYYDDSADPTAAELIVAKHRNGPTGAVPLIWDSDCTRFHYRSESK